MSRTKRGRPGGGRPQKQNAPGAGFDTIITTKAGAAAILANRLAAYGGDRFRRNHEPSFWLHTRLADLHTRRTSGQVTRCEHLRSILHPIAVHALWAPGRLVCIDCCMPQLLLTGDDDKTCDRCGQVVDRIHPEQMVAEGDPTLIVFGLCGPCHHREAAS